MVVVVEEGGGVLKSIKFQSNSDGGQCGISQTTLDHLITVGEKLALVEVELYQKGTCGVHFSYIVG